jgi:D-glycerate 3-kinase
MPAEPDPQILAAVLAEAQPRGAGTRVIGICGAQGSGKTTLARAVVDHARRGGVAAVSLSLDDLYLTRGERAALARDVHPLLCTRGVAGTHDVGLGLAVLAALRRGEAVRLPRFDKAADDRCPRARWPLAPANCALVVFEGWCVGARPQPAAALREPINALEAREDGDGRWRTFANDALAGPYQRLFAMIDTLVLLAAPRFEVVLDWRLQQEAELRASAGAEAAGVMDAGGVARFVQHYERLTRHILAEMPGRADLVVELAPDRSPRAIRTPGARR